jgi:hypothetical protein
MTKQQQAKAASLVILTVYRIKRDCTAYGVRYTAGSVVVKVRNGEGREYCVTLRRNKVHSCNCPATKTCYHIETVRAYINAQNTAKRAAKKTERNDEKRAQAHVALAEWMSGLNAALPTGAECDASCAPIAESIPGYSIEFDAGKWYALKNDKYMYKSDNIHVAAFLTPQEALDFINAQRSSAQKEDQTYDTILAEAEKLLANDEPKISSEKRNYAPLNGNRGFSMMK